MKNEDTSFLGQGWSFPPTFGEAGAALELVAGEEDIKQSLQILLSTNLQERFLQPAYGCELRQFVYEELSEGTVNHLVNVVKNAILYHEPRITVNDVNVTYSDQNNALLLINIDYTIRTVNSRNNLVFPFYLTEATLAGF